MEDSTTYVVQLISAGLVLLGFLALILLVDKIAQRIADNSTSQKQPVIYLLNTIAKVALTIIGIITAMGAAGINVSALIASLGISGLALSIASKDAFSNLLAGIMMILNQPFQIGDTIEVGPLKGEVIKMNLRYTHLKSGHKEILVPNSILLKRNISIHHKP